VRPSEIRPARPEDMPELVNLCLVARGESAAGPQVCPPDPEVIARQLGAMAATPGALILTAWSENLLVGLMLGRIVGPGPFVAEASLAVEAVYVAQEHRRRGVGRALVGTAAEMAEEAGADQAYAAPVMGARDLRRFLMRLGFAPSGAGRVTSLAALRRRLARDLAYAGRNPGRQGLEDLIALRRQAKAAGAGTAGTSQESAASRATLAVTLSQLTGLSTSMQVRRAVQIRRKTASSTTIS
jgi:GNAT superfamily N-acetyltransferase